MLAVSSLVAGYTTPIVGPVSFSVAVGEIVGLEGPNGSGKTMIFNAIIGTCRILSGEIQRRPGTRLSVQRQYPVRLGEMPIVGRELLALTGALHRPIPPQLAPLMDLRIDRVSGGQFQLMQVWACLGSPAELVLLDEPTNNMDPEAMETLIGLFRNALDGRSVLVISHDHDLLRRICTRIVDITA